MAGDDLPVDEADHHVDEDDQGEQITRRGPGLPLGLDQERQAPQQQEDHGGELGGEVHPEPQPGAGLPPRLGDLLPYIGRAGVLGRRRFVALGVVLEEEQHQYEDDDTGHRTADERRGPAEVAQQPGDDEGGDQIARHPEEPGELCDQRTLSGGEPVGAQAQYGDEGHRVTAAEQGAGGERYAVRGGEGEAELADGEKRHADGEHPSVPSRSTMRPTGICIPA